jgi:hypothetical protein
MARLLILSLLLFFFGLTVCADGPDRRPPLPVFKKSILQHIERLPVYAKIIFMEKSHHFKGLGALPRQTALRLIDIRLSMHDLLKPMEMEQLRELGYTGNRTFLDQLYEVYGKKIRPPFIDEMNEMEHRVIAERMQEVLQELGVPIYMRALILEDLDVLELVVDVIDTKWHRGSELGFEYHRYDAYKFLADKKKLEAADLARFYEKTYYPYKDSGARACTSAHH